MYLYYNLLCWMSIILFKNILGNKKGLIYSLLLKHKKEAGTLRTGLHEYTMNCLVFFNDMNFQIIKFNSFDKIILIKSGFIMALEFCNGRIQPDGFS